MTTEAEAGTRNEEIRTAGGRRTLWLQQVSAFVKRYLRELMRSRAALFWSLGFPAAFYLLTITVFIPMDQIPVEFHPEVKATTAISYGVFGAVIVCLNAFAEQLVTDIEDQRYVAFRSLPISPSADFAGRSAAALLFALAAFAFVLLVSVPTGAAYSLRSIASIPIAFAALVLSSGMWLVVALVIAVLTSDARYANIIAVSIALAAFFITGFNGSQPRSFALSKELLNVLPNALATRMVSYHIVALDSWREAGWVPPEMPTGPEYLGLVLVYGIVFVLVGGAIMNRVVYKRRAWQ